MLMVLVSATFTVNATEEDQKRTARDIIQVLEAYAVYKMGQYDLAFERYLVLAEKGNRQGMLNVANMYADGIGVKQNRHQAFEWHRRLAESGDCIGIEAVAEAYRQGNGVSQDPEKAADWERLAARAECSFL